MSGYDLVQFFDGSSGYVWAAPQSQIYPTLRRMEQAGLITGDDEQRGPRLTRTVYSVTDKGLAELRKWLATPIKEQPLRDPLLLQALNFDMIEPEQAHEVLEQFIREQEATAEEAEGHRDRLLRQETPLLVERLSRRDPDDHDRIARIKAHVFDGLAAVARTRVEWAREGQRLLAAPSGGSHRSKTGPVGPVASDFRANPGRGPRDFSE